MAYPRRLPILSPAMEGKLTDANDDDLPDTDATGGTTNWPRINGEWGNPSTADTPEKIDDLWHAAYNSDGKFLSADTPQAVTDGLSEAIADIVARNASSAAVAVNVSFLTSETLVFQVRFDSKEWDGELLAFKISTGDAPDSSDPCWDNTAIPPGPLPRGAICGDASNPYWNAQTQIEAAFAGNDNSHLSRKVITYKPSSGAGIPFRWPVDPTSPETPKFLNFRNFGVSGQV